MLATDIIKKLESLLNHPITSDVYTYTHNIDIYPHHITVSKLYFFIMDWCRPSLQLVVKVDTLLLTKGDIQTLTILNALDLERLYDSLDSGVVSKAKYMDYMSYKQYPELKTAKGATNKIKELLRLGH